MGCRANACIVDVILPRPAITSSALVSDYGTELLLRFADFLPLSFSLQCFGGIVFLILERLYPIPLHTTRIA